MNPGTRIYYKTLRRINPEAARQAVLEYLDSNGGNSSEAARMSAVNRSVVYDILQKQAAGDLKDPSKVSKHQPNRTSPQIEQQQVVEAQKNTRLGSQRLTKAEIRSLHHSFSTPSFPGREPSDTITKKWCRPDLTFLVFVV